MSDINDVYSKLNKLISEKKQRLMDMLPSTHFINDGIIIRFFDGWESAEGNIKVHEIYNHDKKCLKSLENDND